MEPDDLTAPEKQQVIDLWNTTDSGLRSMWDDHTPVKPVQDKAVFRRLTAIKFILEFDEDERLSHGELSARDALGLEPGQRVGEV